MDHPIFSAVLLTLLGIAMQYAVRELRARKMIPRDPPEPSPWRTICVVDDGGSFNLSVPFLPVDGELLYVPKRKVDEGGFTVLDPYNRRAMRVESVIFESCQDVEAVAGPFDIVAVVTVRELRQDELRPEQGPLPEETSSPGASSVEGPVQWRPSPACRGRDLLPCTHPDAKVCRRIGSGDACECLVCHPTFPSLDPNQTA